MTKSMNLKLKPSARAKKIYLLLEGGNRADVERRVLDYLGALGWAKASPIFVEGGKGEGRMILAIERGELNNVRAALEAGSPGIKILKTAGTIKAVEK